MKNKWLLRLQEKQEACTDKADTVIVSAMAVPTLSISEENGMIIEENNGYAGTDRTDIVTVPGMSVPVQGELEHNNRLNLSNESFNHTNVSSTLSSLADDYKERLAIAEYDGRQDTLQAHRIAYEDALIAILNANPPDNVAKPDTDWFMDRVKVMEGWLSSQGIVRPS